MVEGSALLDLGTLPAPAIGAGVRVGFSSARARVQLGVGYFPPRFAPAGLPEPAKGADVSLLTAGPIVCYEAVPGPVELAPCGSLEIGAMVAEGRAFRQAWSAVRGRVAIGASLELVVRGLGPLTVHASLGGQLPLRSAPVNFRSSTGIDRELHRPGAVVGRGGLGLGYAFR